MGGGGQDRRMEVDCASCEESIATFMNFQTMQPLQFSELNKFSKLFFGLTSLSLFQGCSVKLLYIKVNGVQHHTDCQFQFKSIPYLDLYLEKMGGMQTENLSFFLFVILMVDLKQGEEEDVVWE